MKLPSERIKEIVKEKGRDFDIDGILSSILNYLDETHLASLEEQNNKNHEFQGIFDETKDILEQNNMTNTQQENIMITHRSVMGALASCAVQQSPYPRPDNLEVVLDKFHELIKDEVNETGKMYVKKFNTWKECHDWIASKLNTIPEYRFWNERKNGNQSPYGFTGAGHHDNGDITFYTAKADDDFIDLDALTRNITNLAIND